MLTENQQFLLNRVLAIKPPRKALFISGWEYDAGWVLHQAGLAHFKVASGPHQTAFLFPVEQAPTDETDRRDEADDVTLYHDVRSA